MSNRLGTYYVSINGGAAVRCEDLALAPVSLTRENLKPDELVLVQSRRRGAWVVEIAHDAVVRFFRAAPGSAVQEPLFFGRVISPVDERGEHERSRLIRVRNVMQFAAESTFHRGDWTPKRLFNGVYDPSGGVVNLANDKQHDRLPLYFGYNWEKWGSTSPWNKYRLKRWRQQSVTEAVRETLWNLRRLADIQALGTEWQAEEVSVFLGTNPLKPSWIAEDQSNSYLEWLVKCLQPVADAFISVGYSGVRPGLRVGRFGDQAATVVQPGYPFTGFNLERARHEEVAGVCFASLVDKLNSDGSGATDRYWLDPGVIGGRMRFSVVKTWPVTPAPNCLHRRVRTVSVETLPSSVTQDKLAAYLGPSMTQPVVNAAVGAADAWGWLAPGAVLSVDGLRLNVQSTTLRFETEITTARAGLPRQLGVEDAAQVAYWLSRWTRRGGAFA